MNPLLSPKLALENTMDAVMQGVPITVHELAALLLWVVSIDGGAK